MIQRPVSYQQLIEYAAGDAPSEKHASIEAYLAVNPDAAAVVARFRAATTAMRDGDHHIAPAGVLQRARAVFDPAAFAAPARAAWWERLEQLVASQVYDNRAQPAAAGVRGHGGSVQLAYQRDAVDLDLNAEPINPSDVGGSHTNWRLVGQVAVDDVAEPIRIAVFAHDANDRPLREFATDERGAFAVELEPGRYELRIAIGEEQIVVEDIAIP